MKAKIEQAKSENKTLRISCTTIATLFLGQQERKKQSVKKLNIEPTK